MALRLDAIRAQIRKLQEQAKALEDAREVGIKAAAQVIAQYGLSLADLKQAMGVGGRRGRRSPLAGRALPAKYRDDKGNTWTGRGRPPLWLVAAEKAGRKRESFLIGAESSKTGATAKSKRRAGQRSARRKSASPTAAQ